MQAISQTEKSAAYVMTSVSIVNSFSTDINPVIAVDADYTVSVTSSTYPVYLRAAVVVYWKTMNENILAEAPSGYTLETSDEWKFHNGFYYYCQPVQVGSDIPPVSTKLVAPVEGQSGYQVGCTLVADLSVQAVQAVGTVDNGSLTAVEQAWGVPTSLSGTNP